MAVAPHSAHVTSSGMSSSASHDDIFQPTPAGLRDQVRMQLQKATSPLNIIGVIVIVVATILLKLWVRDGRNRRWFFCNILNLIDLLSIMPWYILFFVELQDECPAGIFGVFNDCDDRGHSTVDSLSVLRAVRLLRVLRVLKLGTFSVGVKVFSTAILRSTPQLIALLIAMFISMLVFSAIVFYMEDLCDEGSSAKLEALRCSDQKQKFRSIPVHVLVVPRHDAAVGYGDMVPYTTLGKLFGGVTMLIGILVFSLPITVIGSNYEKAYHAEVMRRLVKELETGVSRAFREMSLDKEAPMLRLEDVRELTRRWSSKWSADHTQLWERIELMWDAYDIRMDGKLDGALSRAQAVKLFHDLKLQLEDHALTFGEGDDQPLFNVKEELGCRHKADVISMGAVAKLSERVRRLDAQIQEHKELIDSITQGICLLGDTAGLHLVPPVGSSMKTSIKDGRKSDPSTVESVPISDGQQRLATDEGQRSESRVYPFGSE
eukprot:CAMPEP_0205881022 /NCGR_PEP_ID=MMETSP1083-20121108/16237_1 /ASSEMBLY_ACC=CAM_ASM_000430 /TAXON_ID=97485 /ORGANISM="Prymnesium parvum, Strain Texoma1" /LENGTH=489 /DNA_ID=CAMNT_0053244077 /DNA_START=38 /DNA_END=1509 /DNA_ORIENTATION=-